MTEVIKGSSFQWNPKAQAAFEEVKRRLTQALVLALPCCDKIFEDSVIHPGLELEGFLLKMGGS